ncbi:hypothetical protein [Prevotella sp. HUN102]|uniref:hypothetical protein n=1 Tax=Prevotella sp. HUN102 TaxID=1392486 RepID=UPI0012DDEDA6|nr:hypothetical protein [Prevotella sp. HUN102]
MRFITLLLLMVAATTMNAQTANTEPIGEPEDKTPTVFYFDDEIYVNTLGFAKRSLIEEKIYFMDNDEVLVREFLDYGGYMKGKIDKGSGTITIENRQPVQHIQFGQNAEKTTIYFACIDPETKKPLTGNFVLEYKDKGNGEIIIDGSKLTYALYYGDAEAPTIYRYAHGIRMTDQTFLDNLTTSAVYEYTDNFYGEGYQQTEAKCIQYGNKIYLKPLETLFSATWQQAYVSKEGEQFTLHIPTDQFLGHYSATESFVFKAGKLNKDAVEATRDMTELVLPMTYDKANHTYKCVAADDEILGAADYFTDNRGMQKEWGTMYEAISITIHETTVTNGIENLTVKDSQRTENHLYYDLQGRAYANPVKGVCIYKGRKIVVK